MERLSQLIPDLAFDPLLATPSLGLLAVLAILAAFIGAAGRLRTLLARLFAAFAIILALMNPQAVTEDRQALNDIVLVLRDMSESVTIGTRQEAANATYKAVIDALQNSENLDVVNAIIPASTDGTKLTASLIESIADIPAARFAGVIAITDGQVHDLIDNPTALMGEDIPFHALIVGEPEIRDRRIKAILAPKYGLVGEQAQFEVQIDDPGHEGEFVPIEIKLNGEVKTRFSAIIGDRVSIPVDIERRGRNTIELVVQGADNELTLVNNVFVSDFSGIRDRLRVLLVTGYPHNGGRAWRNLLKSDPAVDLVQFTILTNPRIKNTRARQNELSLIAFPTRQLFEEKLDEFDLIIFDQFQRRFRPGRSGGAIPILQPYYLQNIAEYVEDGGALLVAAGPSFAGEESLYRSPLAAVLPTRPTGEMLQTGFTPLLNEKGKRHPITAGFSGKADQNWGQWFRIIENNVVSGDVLMEGPNGEPLLVIEKIGDGRVGMVLSDQAWLWAKGFKGGGPYSEMFRRLSHWLMGEPDLSAEKLSGRIEGDRLMIERRTLTDDDQTVFIERPDGTSRSLDLTKNRNGVYTGELTVAGQGAYRISSGDISTVAAVGTLNPKEYANLTPTKEILQDFVEKTDGFIEYVSADALPQVRRVDASKTKHGENWLGLTAHESYIIQASSRRPFAPGILYFILALLAISWAWWREAR